MSAIGLDINPPFMKTAVVDGQGVVQPLAYAELISLYKFGDKGAMPKPAGLTEWCSSLEFPLPGKLGVGQRLMANNILKATLANLLQKTSALLADPVQHVSVTVPSSLGERDRAWIRKAVQGFGYEAKLFNEDQALLKASPELCSSSAVLIYNMRGTTVEISFYRFTGKSLRIEQLEVIEQCGTEVMEHILLAALLRNQTKGLTLDQYHVALQKVHGACSQWQAGESLRIANKGGDALNGAELTAEEASAALRPMLMPSLTAVRAIIPTDIIPLVVFLSHEPHPVIVANMLQSTVGLPIRHISRERVLAGAALQASQLGGRNEIVTPAGKTLPEQVALALGQNTTVPPQGEKSSAKSSVPMEPDRAVDSLQAMLTNLAEQIATLPLPAVEEMFPALRRNTEEFLAKVVDVAAKKMIDKHDFHGAFKLYDSYWHRHTGFNILEAPAVGLCLAQSRTAFKKRDIKAAKRWCRRGLRFSPQNKDLLDLKHVYTCNCPKCKAARGQ